MSGKKFSNCILRCIDCTLDTGKIAAVYGTRVFIFEPTPSIKKKASHVSYFNFSFQAIISVIQGPFFLYHFTSNFNFLIFVNKKNIHYKWIQVGFIETNSDIVCISWNNDGSRLLVGCSVGTIQLWSYNSNNSDSSEEAPLSANANTNEPVKFSICEEETLDYDNTEYSYKTEKTPSQAKISKAKQTNQNNDESFAITHSIFKKIWEKQLATAVKCLKFSPDGSLFASYGEVKIKFKLKHIDPIMVMILI